MEEEITEGFIRGLINGLLDSLFRMRERNHPLKIVPDESKCIWNPSSITEQSEERSTQKPALQLIGHFLFSNSSEREITITGFNLIDSRAHQKYYARIDSVIDGETQVPVIPSKETRTIMVTAFYTPLFLDENSEREQSFKIEFLNSLGEKDKLNTVFKKFPPHRL